MLTGFSMKMAGEPKLRFFGRAEMNIAGQMYRFFNWASVKCGRAAFGRVCYRGVSNLLEA